MAIIVCYVGFQPFYWVFSVYERSGFSLAWRFKTYVQSAKVQYDDIRLGNFSLARKAQRKTFASVKPFSVRFRVNRNLQNLAPNSGWVIRWWDCLGFVAWGQLGPRTTVCRTRLSNVKYYSSIVSLSRNSKKKRFILSYILKFIEKLRPQYDYTQLFCNTSKKRYVNIFKSFLFIFLCMYYVVCKCKTCFNVFLI